MTPSSISACIALTFTVLGANTYCCCLFHQQEKPDLKSLRKFYGAVGGEAYPLYY